MKQGSYKDKIYFLYHQPESITDLFWNGCEEEYITRIQVKTWEKSVRKCIDLNKT